MKNLLSNHTIIGWFTFFASLLVYIITLEPTVSFWDSGEFIASSYKLQVPHPPGPPLFLLIGRMFSMMAMGNTENVGFWVNMVSAVSSAGTVMFLYWIIIMLGKKIKTVQSQLILTFAGIIGALSFAFSDTFWFSASETEVYALSTFFIASVVWAILKVEKEDDSKAEFKWIILIAYLMGLSIGVHPISLLAIPTLVYILYFKKRAITFRGFLFSSIVGLGLTLFMMYGFRLGLIGMIKNFEMLFVNNLGLPFYSGAIFFAILLVGILGYAISYSAKRNHAILNTALLSLCFVIIGYSSYTSIVIRSGHNPPIDQNNPEDIPNLIGYLDMLQYGTRPLVYGENFTSTPIDYKSGATIYKKGKVEYEVADKITDYKYDSSDLSFFPRMYSQSAHHVAGYKQWSGLKEGEVPTFSDNIKFFLSYQVGHMYLRYFLWNFVGREGDFQNAGWLTFWEDTSILPDSLKNDKARNDFLFIPFLLGLFGLFYQYKNHGKSFLGILALFLITGVGLVVYLNSPAPEPRERDYIFIGSFFSFAIWIGLGVMAIYSHLIRFKLQKVAVPITLTIALAAPSLLLIEGWDDHDRSDRYLTSDIARNHLASCAENAILFTGGDNDTFPLWYAQEVEDYRTDIRAIVLSYFNADWYINQMIRPAYKSEPLPFSLLPENYQRGSLNDYLPVVERANIKNGTIDLKQYLSLIKKSHPALQIETKNGQKINTLPAKKLSLEVNIDQIKAKEIVPDTISPFLTSRLTINVTKGALHKSDLMILDLIASNNWERPIYFTYTALNSLNFDISHMVVQEGYTYRLLPVQIPEDQEYTADSKTMFDNLMTNFQWRETTNKKVYYSSYHKNQMVHVRSNFNQLATTLLQEGDLDKAKETLERSLEVLPDDTIPYDVASITTARIFSEIGEKEKGQGITRTMVERVDRELAYYTTHRKNEFEKVRRNFTLLNMLSQAIRQTGDIEDANRTELLLKKYYDRIQEII